jgi:hypothetical protein
MKILYSLNMRNDYIVTGTILQGCFLGGIFIADIRLSKKEVEGIR